MRLHTFYFTTALCSTSLLGLAHHADAASFIVAGDTNGFDIVTHAGGYDGTGGVVNITVGVDATSVNATDMLVSAQNVVNTFNGMTPTVNNVVTGVIQNNQIDFESVLLHEMGHSLGLSHDNLASDSGLPDAQQRATYSTRGGDGTFDVDAGTDGVIGTADDVRGDDVNLTYFRIGSNDPFDTNLGVVDSTTYSRDIADLPAGDNFVAAPTREVAATLGYVSTESVMTQLSVFGEVQRTLGASDVAALLYAQSGVDSLAGTADDYTLNLQFVGLTSTADILIDFDNTQTGFGVSQSSLTFLSGNDLAITGNNVYFNSGFNWIFNQTSNAAMPVPVPASGMFLGFGVVALTALRRRRQKR